MDQKELQKQIALYYSKLPADVQAVFAKMEWLETLKKLCEKYVLSNEQIQTLGTETTLLLLGIISVDEYESYVKNLGLTLENTDKILTEINETVLKEVRPKLDDNFYANAKELAKQQGEIKEELDARFDKLSPDIRQVIMDVGYHTMLYAIAKSNKLDIPKMGILEEVTTSVIVGDLHPDQYEYTLRDKLDLSLEATQKIADEVNTKILKVIREKMEIYYGKSREGDDNLKNTDVAPGIKIIKPDLTLPELESGNPKNQEPKTIKIKTILDQKLTGEVKNQNIKTDYTLKNLPGVAQSNKTTNTDPYREIPE